MYKTAVTIIAILPAILSAGCAILELDKEVKKVGVQVEQQSMLINRALGKVVPLVLPQDVEEEITSVEDRLNNSSKWPTDVTQIQQLNDRLAGLVNKLPPWAQEELLPRLVPRRWEIEALWILESGPSTDVDADNLVTYVSSIESHLSKKPTESSAEMEKLLEQKMQNTKVEIPKAERSAAIEAAKLAIESKMGFEAAARQLVVYGDEEAKLLLKRLSDTILENTFTQEISLVESDLEKFEKLPDASLREYAIVRANQAALDIHLRMFSSGIREARLDEKIKALEISVEKSIKDVSSAKQLRDAEKLKRYQVWALNEIKQVRSMQTITEIEGKKISSDWVRRNPFANATKEAERNSLRILLDEFVTHMSPINQAYLEPAVSQWFGKVYQDRFSRFSNEGDQLEIVTRFATTSKRMIE